MREKKRKEGRKWRDGNRENREENEENNRENKEWCVCVCDVLWLCDMLCMCVCVRGDKRGGGKEKEKL